MDAIARELGLDPLAGAAAQHDRARRTCPTRMATGEVLRDVTPRETLEAALAAIDYDAFRARQARRARAGPLLGLGLCTVVESTTYGSAFYKSAGIPGSGHEAAWLRIEPSGAVNASVGLGATGQGYETALAQAVADGPRRRPGERCASSSATPTSRPTAWAAAARAAARPAAACSTCARCDARRQGAGDRGAACSELRRRDRRCACSTAAMRAPACDGRGWQPTPA